MPSQKYEFWIMYLAFDWRRQGKTWSTKNRKILLRIERWLQKDKHTAVGYRHSNWNYDIFHSFFLCICATTQWDSKMSHSPLDKRCWNIFNENFGSQFARRKTIFQSKNNRKTKTKYDYCIGLSSSGLCVFNCIVWMLFHIFTRDRIAFFN